MKTCNFLCKKAKWDHATKYFVKENVKSVLRNLLFFVLCNISNAKLMAKCTENADD